MKFSSFTRDVLAVGIACTLLAGCSTLQDGMQPPIGGAQAPTSSNATTFHVLYRFQPGADAEVPEAPLIAVHGALFGTTVGGGVSSRCEDGCGTAYEVTFSKTGVSERVIYNTPGYSEAALLAVRDLLYGTTKIGGNRRCYSSSTCGTIFRLTPSGPRYRAAILHDFTGSDGGLPTAPLIDVSGKLYGTASSGGTSSSGSTPYSGGVAYVLGEAGAGYRVIHYFEGSSDGLNPNAGLVDVGGTFYGTTFGGGNAGLGVVYELKPKGNGFEEHTVYSFQGGTDGSNPISAVIALHGVLYGTTSEGGNSACTGGCGTIYRITPGKSSAESVIYRFRGNPDGGYPSSALTAVGENLYGTTALGGESNCVSGRGCGTIFELSPSGRSYKERVLHRFDGAEGGYSPQGGLTAMNHLLYGTTAWGGDLNCNYGGCGTLFSIEP